MVSMVTAGQASRGVEVVPPIEATFSGGADRGLLGFGRPDTILRTNDGGRI
jgi:hypothetical protein